MKKNLFTQVKWQVGLIFLGILAIALHFIINELAPSFANWPLFLVIFLGAGPLLWQIGLKLYEKDFGSDILAALSIIAAFILGEYLACVLVIIMLSSGQALETYALKRASSVLQALAKRMPAKARRKKGGKLETIDIIDIQIGDLIVIAPHETAPVDGIIAEGHGFMDESYLTGEPYRVPKIPGSNILSGAINGETLLLMKALKLPKDSRYSQIIKVMEEAEQKRPKIRRLADQLGGIFAPIALLIAAAAWVYSGDPIRFLSVLVIATPCPLLIAIPVAIISTISMAARRSIIIRDPVVLERLPTCKTAIFDKTGTLTYGKPVLSEIIISPGFLEEEILQKVASLEQYSKHPLAQAVVQAAKNANLYLVDPKNIKEPPGQGLVGDVENTLVTVTGRHKLLLKKPHLATQLPPPSVGLECVILLDDVYAATMRFHDEPKADSKSFISHLGPFHAFEKVMLLSGDRESEVSYFAKKLGIKEMLASQTPEQKVQIVTKEAKKAPTLFMGDGINDAPALRAATVGIAFGEPSDVTRESAGAVIMENTLAKVDELLHLSYNMRKIALQSAIGGIVLSFVGMGFAAYGFISPVAGALLQQIIDVAAIINALRITWQRDVKIDLPK